MEIKTDRYKINIEELVEGGPGGYESVYLTSEGDPAPQQLYTIFDRLNGRLLPASNRQIRQRNGTALLDALTDDKSIAVVSGFKPSGAYHFGHKLTSAAVGFFQKNGGQAFVPVADIECEMDTRMPREQYQFWAADNLLDWGANGVNLDAAHVYLQSEEHRVNSLSYHVARSLSFKLATDIYGAQKLIDDFPFLFAGITQVGDILLPQHQEFGVHHSFMVSGQDQDGHMKMTIALAQATLDSGAGFLGVQTVPSGFYIPHIRGISGDKASSSRTEGTLYLGAGPTNEDLVERTASTLRKLDGADKDNMEKCSLDMVRNIDYFNNRSRVLFQEITSEPGYQFLQDNVSSAVSREDQARAQNALDVFLIKHCMDQGQNNVEIIRDCLPGALLDHYKKRVAILDYAKSKAAYRPSGGWGDDESPLQPDFWMVPDSARVNQDRRNSTQWFHIIDRASDQIIP